MSKVKKVIKNQWTILEQNTQWYTPNMIVKEIYQCSRQNYDLLKNSVCENKIYITNETR